MTHPTTDQSIRERLARAAFGVHRRPNLSIEDWSLCSQRDKDPWLDYVDAILAELQEPSLHAELLRASKGMLTDVQLHGLWDCVRHIRDGGK